MKDLRTLIRCRSLTQDPRYAALLLPAYRETLAAIASYTYRSLLTQTCAEELSALFDHLATSALRHFQAIGDLIVALGGNPILYTRVAPDAERAAPSRDVPLPCVLLEEGIREEQAAIDRMETLMGKTDDRVVRSIVCRLVSEKQASLRCLTQMRNIQN